MAIENQVERFAPGFRDLVLARVAHDTAAMERHNPNLVGGDIGGGHAGLTQFVRRPRLSPHPWSTPLPVRLPLPSLRRQRPSPCQTVSQTSSRRSCLRW